VKALGIDFGTKRIGIAVSDERGEIAFPRAVLVAMPGVIGEIAALAREEGVASVVIGESRDGRGGENALQRAIRQFRDELERALPDARFSFEHEGMSTQSARSKALVRRGTLTRERLSSAARARARRPADARAAAVILQRFLDSTHHVVSP
jgi:putative Holliday junction resolvase